MRPEKYFDRLGFETFEMVGNFATGYYLWSTDDEDNMEPLVMVVPMNEEEPQSENTLYRVSMRINNYTPHECHKNLTMKQAKAVVKSLDLESLKK